MLKVNRRIEVQEKQASAPTETVSALQQLQKKTEMGREQLISTYAKDRDTVLTASTDSLRRLARLVSGREAKESPYNSVA
jgi:hypothetical protein